MSQTLKSATVKDVAEQAQVSVATVSRVLNGKESVDPGLYQRVMEAVDALQYRPNRLARNLRKNSTNIIALVVPDIQNAFFVSVAHSVEEATFQKGYTVVICNTNDDPQRERQYFQTLIDEACAGIIVCVTDERLGHVEVQKALDRGIAVVALDRRLEDVAVDSVLSDNFGGSRLAVSYLIEQGHRRIGVIAGSDRFAPGRERRMGYEQALIDAGLPLDRSLIKVTEFTVLESEAAADELMGQPEPPTALFICSAHAAIGSLRAINRRGLRIPDDISLLTFDDLDWTEVYNPPITAVAQNTRQLGITAAKLLLERINGVQEIPQERRLPTELRIRNSCRSIDRD